LSRFVHIRPFQSTTEKRWSSIWCDKAASVSENEEY
jgi:hypothetical protein